MPIIQVMKQPVVVRGPEPYVAAILGLWRDLELTLDRLDELADVPAQQLEHEAPTDLARLQYRLHAASEAVLELAPPAEAMEAHRDLADALVGAREATAAVAGALEDGDPLDGFQYEWRGALFRVRLARMELAREGRSGVRRIPWTRVHGGALLATAVAAVAVGAHASAWSVVAAGVVAIAAGVLLLVRP
jgi:hypothetical protein